MWDLPRVVLIQKARNALRDGRIDEAFAIATDGKLEDYRQCQVLLQRLVAPLLARARSHLEAGRIEDALADVERAQRAGGNEPETASLREEILLALSKERERRNADRSALESARRRLSDGRLAEASRRLAEAGDRAAAEGLQRRLDDLRNRAAAARGRIERRLEEGDLAGALGGLEELRAAAAGEPETAELAARIFGEVASSLDRAFASGELLEARRLLEAAAAGKELRGSEELRRHRDVSELCERAALAMRRGDWAASRTALRRLRRLLPNARWLGAAEKQARLMEETLRELRGGPLGELMSCHGGDAPSPETLTATAPAPAPLASPASRGGAEAAGAGTEARGEAAKHRAAERYLLWIDGVGAYLILPADAVGIGRAGSSARPDIALTADLEGIHAQIVRADHDYFLIARGRVEVDGSPVERHLLSDGDRILLGSRHRLTFRLPTNLSATALVELDSGLRLEGDVRTVVLLDGHLVLSGEGGCHLHVPRLNGRVILSRDGGGFRVKSPSPLVIDGRSSGEKEARVPLEAHVEAGELTFTLTALERQGEER